MAARRYSPSYCLSPFPQRRDKETAVAATVEDCKITRAGRPKMADVRNAIFHSEIFVNVAAG